MFSAFHFHANRGDKRFKQLYKSSEKRIEPKPDKQAEVENNLNRSRNSRYMLVEKFRQAQGYSPDHQSLDPNQVKEQREREQQEEEEEAEADEREHDSNAHSFSGNIQRRHSGSSFEEVRYGRGRRHRSHGDEEAQGFDYSSSYNGSFAEVLTFNLSRDCNEADLFNNNVYKERFSQQQSRQGASADGRLNYSSLSNDCLRPGPSGAGASLSFSGAAKYQVRSPFNWEFDDDYSLLCVKCERNSLQMNGSTLHCTNCSFENKSEHFSIRNVKQHIKSFERQHKFACDSELEYVAKGQQLKLVCSSCDLSLCI